MLAHHRGLRSLGQVMALGSIACLLATVIVLPAMLAVLEHLKNRLEPIEDD
jgi:predicted RND superfamily exporter protein